MRFAVVIPAYRPSASLIDLIRALHEKGIPAIVIVDDGSGPEYRDVFSQAVALPNVHLLRHTVNLGKGAALKTGMNHALCSFPGLGGIVTADADGQHHPDDIERVANTLMAQPECLVLGCRAFDGNVPWRSRFGNGVTRMVMRAVIGQKLADTQTGLRGIPASLAPRLLRLEAAGYEFELEMLIAAHRLSIPVIEEPIRTIYAPGNLSSHFNPIIDSMKIYWVLLRFSSVSLMTAVLDNLVFYLAFHRFGHILGSQILGRLAAVGFNYSMVRRSVFYSKERHRTVLPKYLLLVLASGATSYAGIRFLSGKLRIGPVSAKLAVETLLFFVNFAIQRMYIFPPRERLRRKRAVPVRSFSLLVFLVLMGLVGLEAYGFRTGHLFSQEIWYPVGLERLARFAGWFLALAVPVLLMAPWAFAALICGLAILGAAVAVGPQPVVATAFFFVSACALGSKLLGRTGKNSVETHLGATLLGTAVYIFLMTILARLPVNYPALWAALLAIPVAIDLRGVGRRFAYWGERLRSVELRSGGERAAFALVVFVLLMHWLVVFKPEASSDGLSMHLAIPANIAANHAMTFEPSRFLWAVMPMGADWVYSIAYLLGGEYAARLLNFALLLVVEALLYCAVRRWVARPAAFLLLALFATTPMVQLVTGSLFVENLLAAMALGVMTALWRFGESGEKKFFYLAATLASAALATKVGALAFLILALPFAMMEARRRWQSLGPKPAASCALAGMLFLLAALPTYAIAWWKTGNPVFPFMHQKFHSPLLDPAADIQDNRFRGPIGWSTPFDLTFHTNRTYEGQDGSFGFQYLILAPLALVALLVVRDRRAVSGSLIALGAAILILRSEPNARYLYAALPLLFVPFAALLGWMASHQRRLYRVLISFAIACTALNACFLPSSSYYHKDFCLESPFSPAQREQYVAYTAPIRAVIAYLNRENPHAVVLLTGDSYLAGLTGEVYENHWHQFTTLDQIRKTLSLPDMRRLMDRWKIQYFIARKPRAGQYTQPPALRDLLETCVVPEYEAGEYYLARLEQDCEARTLSMVVPPGRYDDFDPAILFRGDWTRSDSFEGPSEHTISFTDTPGAEVLFAFEGNALTYVFTKAPNRGLAEIEIDGISKGTVDLYSPDIQWRNRSTYCCLGLGRHLVRIRVAGRSHARSRGQFVDLDLLVVE